MAHAKLLTLDKAGPVQMGFWVPNRVWATAKYLVPLRDEIAAKKRDGTLAPLREEIQSFKGWVTANSVYRMWVTAMIDQANGFVLTLDERTKEEIKDEDGDRVWIKGYDEFFEILNVIVETTPAFVTTDGGNPIAMIGTPMNALLAIAMATEAGLALFHDATFNAQLKEKVLDTWNEYLKSSKSIEHHFEVTPLGGEDVEGSWCSQAAWDAGVWDEMVIHDAKKAAYGYASWNDFFLRLFVKDARPFHGKEEEVVNIGCETTPWQYEADLQYKSKFWIKDVNYSLLDLFGGDKEWARCFEDGQAYQGFLSATHYHRWNAPLKGKIVRSWVQAGTYFAQRPGQGQNAGTWEGTESQPYLGHVATRAIFILEHPTCGYVALICIGMVEVSTCAIKKGYEVKKGAPPKDIERGEEIGHFEFGGSTHMMIFQKDKVDLAEWALEAETHRLDPNPTPMGTVIAKAKRKAD